MSKSLISREVKGQILKRVKDDGIPISQLAQEHGITPRTIYQWIARSVTAPPSVLEIGKLKRENQALKEMLGELTMELSLAKKKADDH